MRRKGQLFLFPIVKIIERVISMLGISIYLGKQSEKEQADYLQKMSNAGFKSIFTSLHIPEDNPEILVSTLKTLAKQAAQLNMELICDISNISIKNLGLSVETLPVLNEWGVTGLRLDYGFEPETISQLSRQMKIALNASTIDDNLYKQLQETGLDFNRVEAWHNYYPRPETGLDKEWFIHRNNWLKERGFLVTAFIPGDDRLRGPLFKGLPTLENHRNMAPFLAYLDLKSCSVDKILLGDPSIQSKTLSQFITYQNGEIPLRCTITTKSKESIELVNLKHRNRMDPARDGIRSETTRSYAQQDGKKLPPENTIDRGMGSITIDNELYGRYRGELQIVKRPLAADEKVNVIGNIIREDLPIISYIGSGNQFKLIITEN